VNYLGAEFGYDVGARWSLGLGWAYQHYGIGFDYAPAGDGGMNLRAISLTSEYRFGTLGAPGEPISPVATPMRNESPNQSGSSVIAYAPS
jgi:hypothetical protein